MSDYPSNLAVPTHIHTGSRYMLGQSMRTAAGITVPGTFTWTANVACYVPLFLPWPYNVRRLFWVNGNTIAGNSDIGIFTASGAQIFAKGSTANAGSSNPAQYVTPSADILLTPGAYLLGWSNDGTTSRAYGWAGTSITAVLGRAIGLYQQSTAFALPGPATFAAYNAVGVPLIGITNTDSGF